MHTSGTGEEENPSKAEWEFLKIKMSLFLTNVIIKIQQVTENTLTFLKVSCSSFMAL